jgi:hypothetical protein
MYYNIRVVNIYRLFNVRDEICTSSAAWILDNHKKCYIICFKTGAYFTIHSKSYFLCRLYRVSATYRDHFSVLWPSVSHKTCLDHSLKTTGAYNWHYQIQWIMLEFAKLLLYHWGNFNETTGLICSSSTYAYYMGFSLEWIGLIMALE